MKQIFVLNDVALATNKDLGALASGEIGAFAFDANSAFGAIDNTATGIETVMFGIGNGTAFPFKTMPILTKLKNAKLTKSTYVAQVLPKFTVVSGVTSYTSHPLDSITVELVSEEHHNQNNRTKEVLEVVVGTTGATATTLNTAIAAKVNELSENFTAVANGSTNVVITAKDMGNIRIVTTFNRYSGAGATTSPTFTITKANGTKGVGTKQIVEELVQSRYQEFGQFETYDNRYGKTSTIQKVNGDKYTLLTFTFTEDKLTTPIRDTHWMEHELIFACDVTATTPSSLVSDLEDFIEALFGVTA